MRHRAGEFSKVKTVGDCRKFALRSRRNTAEIKRQSITQQFDPQRLSRPNRRRLSAGVLTKWIVADACCLLVLRKGPNVDAIRPLAFGKQQMQLRRIGTLRL